MRRKTARRLQNLTKMDDVCGNRRMCGIRMDLYTMPIASGIRTWHCRGPNGPTSPVKASDDCCIVQSISYQRGRHRPARRRSTARRMNFVATVGTVPIDCTTCRMLPSSAQSRFVARRQHISSAPSHQPPRGPPQR